MQIIFRKWDDGAPPAHELWVRPANALNRDRRDLAVLACAEGPQAFEHGAGELTTIVVQQDPTLDDMLAALVLERQLSSRRLPDGFDAVCRYAALAREGLRPGRVPIEDSVEGVLAAIRDEAGGDLTDPAKGAKYLRDWRDLAEAILTGIERGLDPFEKSLVVGDSRFVRVRAFLQEDHKRYQHDVQNGNRWLIEIPGRPGTASGLLLTSPKSVLWKHWARCDEDAPVGKAYLFTAVNWGNGQWVFSTDPVHRQSIQSLADVLNTAEARAPGNSSGSDPWYDGKRHSYTLVGAPRAGSKLTPQQVVRIVKKWCRARRAPDRDKDPVKWLLAGVAVVAVGALAVVSLRPPAVDEDEIPPTPQVTVDDHTFDPTPNDANQLFIIGIGISDYADDAMDLQYADDDARELTQVFREESAGLFAGTADVQLITDGAAVGETGTLAPTRDNILGALLKLEDPGTGITANDLVVITISAHGKTDREGDYYLLTSGYTSLQDPRLHGLSWNSDIVKTLRRLPCTTIVILDTCESGGISHAGTKARGSLNPRRFEVALESAREAYQGNQKGVVVLPACLTLDKAHEDHSWKHGALTLAVLEALQGKVREVSIDSSADAEAEGWLPKPTDGVVQFSEVVWYAQKRVASLTQHLTPDKRGQYVSPWQSNDQLVIRKIPLANRNRPAGRP
ncbi:MAG: caspase family protein [Planctomycetaceae bacterium]|nr:caspase family protein [Planctomycetaceae bacterium]